MTSFNTSGTFRVTAFRDTLENLRKMRCTKGIEERIPVFRCGLYCLLVKQTLNSGMDNPDVLKLFYRHSVWMIRISVLVKVNGIRHYSFIDLILPCFSHK
jgi:hypothetical protein